MNQKDNSFEQQMSHYRTQAILGIVVAVLGVIIFLKAIISTFSMFPTLLGFAIIASGIGLFAHASSSMKNKVGVVIARKVMDRIFDSYQYLPDHHISDQIIENTEIPNLGYFEDIEGNDYISGKYKGLNFEMSDIHLTRTETTTDSDGHTSTTTVTVFNGLWFICDFAKEIRSRITVSPKVLLSFSKGIQTESEVFNKTFYVKAGNDHDAFYVLTPHLMEKMVMTRNHVNCEMYYAFEKDGKVQILVNRGNSLEVNALSSSVEKLEEKFEKQLTEVTSLVDELKLTEAYH